MAAIAWPYKLSPTHSTSKVDCSHEHSNSIKKLTTQTHLSFSCSSSNQIIKYLVPKTYQLSNSNTTTTTTITSICATLNGPRGFGPSPKKTKKTKKSNTRNDSDDDGDGDGGGSGDEEAEAGVIPEIVTNRMISRIGFSVGIPLFIGLLFFPFFYYLKVVLKIDVPSWVPVIVSFIFFGTALLGVSYGIVSSSWDPLREGSLLGWSEAQKNWPVFWQSLWTGGSRKK